MEVNKLVEIKNVDVYGLDRALNARANSFNVGEIDTTKPFDYDSRQWDVSKSLGSSMQPHQSHDSFLSGVTVEFDIKTNNVINPEVQRYHWWQIVMSQSTMHSLKKFFSSNFDPFTKYVTKETKVLMEKYFGDWQRAVEAKKLKTTPETTRKEYEAYMTLRHNLPSGMELWQTVTTNYLQLKTICIQRRGHRNREDWNAVISMCYSLPHFRELTGLDGKEWDLLEV